MRGARTPKFCRIFVNIENDLFKKSHDLFKFMLQKKVHRGKLGSELDKFESLQGFFKSFKNTLFLKKVRPGKLLGPLEKIGLP